HYEHNRRTPDRDRVILFLGNFRRQYPASVTEAVAAALLRAYDPARPISPDEWAAVFGPAAVQGRSPVPQGLAPPAPFAHPVMDAGPGLEMPEGTMDPQSAFYVARPADALAQATIRQPGVTITIKGPRQVGKSSLLYRTLRAAHAAGKRVVLLNFQ